MGLRLNLIFKISFWLSLIGVLVFILDFGIPHNAAVSNLLLWFYSSILVVGLASLAVRYYHSHRKSFLWVKVFDIITVMFTIAILFLPFYQQKVHAISDILFMENWVRFAVIFTFIREFSELNITYKKARFNPAQIFVFSFFMIILIGSFLLMLPNAATKDLIFTDALFMSTSAVCVTGLSVLDISKDLTFFGQCIMLFLFQVGGLGILTFVSYFSYFFKGGASYENQLMLSDLTGSNKLGNVFSALKNIIYITFSIELISAFCIFISVDNIPFNNLFDRIFFSIFHSVSAFTHASFSLLSGNFYDPLVQFNYTLQCIIAFTILLGGLGFPIIQNMVAYLKYWISLLLDRSKEKIHRPWVLTINSRITLITTLSVLVVSFFVFLALEHNNTLAMHSWTGKVSGAFFSVTTPRTSGFNSVDMGLLHLPTIMLLMLLMWIGASPASTGGGIKTSTFALATLNILSLAKGKENIEVFRREISAMSVRRASATISLSLIILGVSIMAVSIFDSEKDLLKIAFECFSAFSTTGLSLGITNQLSNPSKIVLIITMFVGRVSLLSLLIAFFRQAKYSKHYKYPVEEIMIN